MIKNKLPDEINCCGCRACANVCPVDAISMQYSPNHFIIPMIDNDKCVDCGLCTKTCPELNPSFVNNERPDFYAFCADDETRRVSASGGMFSVIAEYVLEHGGYVCGAAFDEDIQLRHKVIHDKSELPPLRSSKYVQSDINDCYKQIKDLLKKGKQVFFCGTPCQVAGLYGVLQDHPENLITADLLCHGVPSQLFLDKYLKEVSGAKKVIAVEFRSKRLGWGHKGIIVKYADGSEHIGYLNGANPDAFHKAFMNKIMLRKSCYDCSFAVYPRQGDFTIGDLWHSDKLDPKSNDKKGTSFLFVNNNKAEKLFKTLRKKAKYCNKIEVDDYSKLPNRVYNKIKIPANRRRFLTLMRYKSFHEAYRQAVTGTYDIGLVGVMGNENIGSVLTYYGLFQTLAEMNYSILPIERPLDSPLKTSNKAKEFNKRWLPAHAQPIQLESIEQMKQLNSKCSQFVVGSDQVFLESMSKKRNNCYFLEWVDEEKNKVGYASSFGGAGARGSREFYRELKYYLDRFSFISCREDDGVKFANETLKLNKKIEWCIDPIFLCKREKLYNIASKANVQRERPFIGAYLIIPKPNLVDLLLKAKDRFTDHDIEIITSDELKSRITNTEVLRDFRKKDAFPIEDTLETILNSRFFITDSFHGVCLAIIFKKDFLVVPRDFYDRFDSLLVRIGLEDRIIKSDLSDFTDAHFESIDYDKVYEKLDAEIQRCRNLLKKSLSVPVKPMTSTEVLMKYINIQKKRIDSLENEIGDMKEMIKALNNLISKSNDGE